MAYKDILFPQPTQKRSRLVTNGQYINKQLAKKVNTKKNNNLNLSILPCQLQ